MHRLRCSGIFYFWSSLFFIHKEHPCINISWFSGTDTTTTALACLLIIVLHDPKIQTRIQNELDNCQPDGDRIRLAHKDQLPYTQAVILETLRFIAHVPLAIPHCTMSDVKLMDYLIPRDTTVSICALEICLYMYLEILIFITFKWLDSQLIQICLQVPFLLTFYVPNLGSRTQNMTSLAF